MSTTISIVTPSYNQGKFLDETIRSVICQRDQIHEYFVFDGGSKDNSVQVIRKYEPWIDQWSSAPDKGQSDAIHKGFSKATGDVIGWLNSDDVFLPGAIAQVRQAFDAHPEWDVLTGYHVRFDGDSLVERCYRTPADSARQCRTGIIRVCQQTCFFRRRLYEEVGGLNLSLHCVMDTELWYRMFKRGTTWGHIPRYLAGYRWHADAKGMSWNQKYAEERKWLSQQYPEYYPTGLKRQLGLLNFRLKHMISGRHFLALYDSWKGRGRRIDAVYGDWVVPEQVTSQSN